MYWEKVCCQEFWYILCGLDVELKQSENEDPAQKQKIGSRLWDSMTHIQFSLHIDTNLWFSGEGK